MPRATTDSFAPLPLRQLLANLLRHSELDVPGQKAILALSGPVAEVQLGADFLRPNTTSVHAYLVARGIVARFDEGKDERRATTALFVPGDLCNLQGIAHQMTTWGLSAFTPCSVIHIPHDALRSLMDKNPAIRSAMWAQLAIDLSIQAKWAASAASKNSLSRTAHLLCELAWRMERAGKGDRGSFTLKTSQTQLARVVGLNPVHLNRVLRDLREQGLITTDAGTIGLTNFGQLSDLAQFDPAYLI